MNAHFQKSKFSPTTLLLIRWIDTCAQKLGDNLYRLSASDDTMDMLEFSSIGAFMSELVRLEQLGLVEFVPCCNVKNIKSFEQLNLTPLGRILMDDLAGFDLTYDLHDVLDQ